MAVWPDIQNPSFPILKIPEFSTNIISYGNSVEQRIAQWAGVRHQFRLSFQTLSQADADTIRKFFILRKGAYESFYWPNPEEASGSPEWQASSPYELNDIIRPITANGRSYIATVAGTSAASEPTWPTTEGGTVVDGGVTWQENSYKVRFKTDLINFDYFSFQLYDLNEVSFVEVA